MGAKIKTKKNTKTLGLPTKPETIPGQTIILKNSHAKPPSLKNTQKGSYFICRTMRPKYADTTTNLQIVVNTPKNH